MALSIRLDAELENRLGALIKQTGRTKTYFVKEALKNYIEDMEDIADAEAAMKEIRDGATTYSAEEVCQRLGIKVPNSEGVK